MGFFTPDIPINIFPQSCNPKGFYQLIPDLTIVHFKRFLFKVTTHGNKDSSCFVLLLHNSTN